MIHTKILIMYLKSRTCIKYTMDSAQRKQDAHYILFTPDMYDKYEMYDMIDSSDIYMRCRVRLIRIKGV